MLVGSRICSLPPALSHKWLSCGLPATRGWERASYMTGTLDQAAAPSGRRKGFTWRRLFQGSASSSDGSQALDNYSFEVLSEEVSFQRYLTLFNRRIKFPPRPDGTEEVHEFDVVGHPRANFHFCVTFPFHPASEQRPAEVTLLREYAQGVNRLAYSLPAGAFDRRKHSSNEECARAELSEEAMLAGGRWVELLPPGHPGIPEVKWCANRFTPYLCIDPQPDAEPAPRDYEEFIEVLRVGIPELRRLMRSGDMMLPSVATCFWALDELAQLGYL